jgi:hypothetical protein
MTESDRNAESKVIRPSPSERLRSSINQGAHWFIALLEAIHKWEYIENEERLSAGRYLIEGEAFDWLVLADYLLSYVADLVPGAQRESLVLFDSRPLNLSNEEFKELIGSAKYRAYLNYLYGVLTEEALILSVIDEVRKEHRSLGLTDETGIEDIAHEQLYGLDEGALVKIFKQEKAHGQRRFLTLTELNEFRYWLFKYRVKRSEKARVASDTKRALTRLHRDAARSKRPTPVSESA